MLPQGAHHPQKDLYRAKKHWLDDLIYFLIFVISLLKYGVKERDKTLKSNILLPDRRGPILSDGGGKLRNPDFRQSLPPYGTLRSK
jgi:hypothetical protein